MKYYVSRQRQWPDGDLMVEVAVGGLDYANPGMLAEKFPQWGEGREFTDPREAANAAVSVWEVWKQTSPTTEIGIGHGATGGMTMPFSDCGADALAEWAEAAYEALPKCAECGELLGAETYTHESADDDRFCREYCAEENYRRQQEDNGPDEHGESDDDDFNGGRDSDAEGRL